jgi:hypothetical protein
VTKELVPPIEPGSVGAQEPFHAGNKVWLRCFNDEMEMIAHEAIGMHLPSGLAAGLIECCQEAFPVRKIAKDIIAMVTAAQDMIDGTRIFDAQLSGHARTMSA